MPCVKFKSHINISVGCMVGWLIARIRHLYLTAANSPPVKQEIKYSLNQMHCNVLLTLCTKTIFFYPSWNTNPVQMKGRSEFEVQHCLQLCEKNVNTGENQSETLHVCAFTIHVKKTISKQSLKCIHFYVTVLLNRRKLHRIMTLWEKSMFTALESSLICLSSYQSIFVTKPHNSFIWAWNYLDLFFF